jgi:hypothetical protein
VKIPRRRYAFLFWAAVILPGGFSQTYAQIQTLPAPVTAETLGHSTNPQPDLRHACTDAGDSPVCAFKAWVACVLYDADGPCRDATAGRVEAAGQPQTIDKQVVEEPWTLSFERLLPEAYGFELFDDGFVPPEAGASLVAATDASETPPALAAIIPASGAYQLVASETDVNAAEWNYQISILFASIDGKWRVIGWSSARASACTGGDGAWPPCRLYLPRPVVRDSSRPSLWSSQRQEGLDPDQRPGVDQQVNVAGSAITAPAAGTITRRPRVYFDSPLYRWIVIDGAQSAKPPTMKLAFVGAEGPAPGAHVDVATVIGRQQPLPFDDPNRAPYVHLEVVMRGKYMDPAAFLGAGARAFSGEVVTGSP